MRIKILLQQIFSILMLSIAFVSCNGQPTWENNQKSGSSSMIPKSETSNMIKQQGTYNYTAFNGPHSDTNVSISSIIEDKKGNIWIATMGEGVYRFNGNTFSNFTDKDGLWTNVVFSILEDQNGTLWFGTSNGVSLYNDTTFHNYSFPNIKSKRSNAEMNKTESFQSGEVPSLMQDKKGNIWIGSTNGVFRFDGTDFTNILDLGTLSSQLNGGHNDFLAVPSIMEDHNETIWFTSWSEGLSHFDGTTITIYKTEGHMLSNRGLIQDKNGDIWIAERGYGGVSRYNGTNFKKQFTDLLITDIKQDNKGNIWFSAYDRKKSISEIIHYNPTSNDIIARINLNGQNGISNISCIMVDKFDNVWMGSGKMTLSKYDGKNVTIIASE